VDDLAAEAQDELDARAMGASDPAEAGAQQAAQDEFPPPLDPAGPWGAP
jgi:hypothetical protein